MSDTVHNASPGGSFLSTRVMNTLRYSVMNLFIIFGTGFIALGGPPLSEWRGELREYLTRERDGAVRAALTGG